MKEGLSHPGQPFFWWRSFITTFTTWPRNTAGVKTWTMKKAFILFAVLVLTCTVSVAQVSINTDGYLPDPSAGLDVKFTDKGFLPPRMTFEQRNAIQNPVEGLMVYCTNGNADGTGVLSMYQGGKWQNLVWNCPVPVTPVAGTPVAGFTEITWNWNTVPIAAGYKWNTVDNFGSATDMGTLTTTTETGLAAQTAYTRYVWAYNACGVSSPVSTSQTTLAFYIGANYGGGKIFYIDGTNQHGLISSLADQMPPPEWGCWGTVISGTSAAIGTGQANTTAIVNGCPTAGIAARVCDDLVLNGYTDWFLPSLDELHQMCAQRSVIGGFNISNCYWSSTETDGNTAMMKSFSSCGQWPNEKNVVTTIRAIRAF